VIEISNFSAKLFSLPFGLKELLDAMPDSMLVLLMWACLKLSIPIALEYSGVAWTHQR
jgi:hypothetical protein